MPRMFGALDRWVTCALAGDGEDIEWEDSDSDLSSEASSSDGEASPSSSSRARSPLEGIWLGGKRGLIVNEILELAFVKMDCRRYSGGRFRDRRAKDAKTRARNMGALREMASGINAAVQKGQSIYVHCSQGINRSPAALTAYLLLHCPEVKSLEAAFALVREIRAIANTERNTFYSELVQLCQEQGKTVKADHCALFRASVVRMC